MTEPLLVPLRTSLSEAQISDLSVDEMRTHPPGEACLFLPDDRPPSPFDTDVFCCLFHAEELRKALFSLTRLDLMERLRDAMGNEEVRGFAAELRSILVELEENAEGVPDWGRMPFGWNVVLTLRGSRNATSARGLDGLTRIVRQGANWFEKIGRLGYCVYSSDFPG
jgi:hypothetical protein